MNTVAELTLGALKGSGVQGTERYARILIESCDLHEPPFGMAWYGEQYRAYAADPYWLATSLMANAEVEGDGASKLWKIAGYAESDGYALQVQRHAVDEARHARLYLHMLDKVFPGALDPETLIAAKAMSPDISMKQALPRTEPVTRLRLLDDLVQMNIGEIRTRIHQQLLRPVILAHCPRSERERITRSLNALLSDETGHIGYTARLIEQHCAAGDEEFVRVTMSKRLEQFNQITLDEVGALIFDGE